MLAGNSQKSGDRIIEMDPTIAKNLLDRARERCETEPFLQPTSIEPHGVLIACSEDDWQIHQLSANAGERLGRTLESLPGQSLSGVLPPEDMATLHRALAEGNRGPLSLTAKLHWPQPTADSGCHAWLHRADGLLILELEPRLLAPTQLPALHTRMLRVIERLNQSTDLDILYRTAATELRGLCEVDQVAVFRFGTDGHGSVVAEDRAPTMPAYLDLRFPASDVPQQVRRHAVQQAIRMTPDVCAEAVALVPARNPRTGKPLDQARCQLRSAHPRASRYYQNMGVRSVLALSVVQADGLWGYICLLHPTPLLLDAELRRVCEILTGVFAAQLAPREAQAQRIHRHRLQTLMEQLLDRLVGAGDWYRHLAEEQALLLELLGAGGAVLRIAGETLRFGATPGSEQLDDLFHWLDRHCEPRYWSDRLPEHYPPARAFQALGAGLMAIALSEPPGDWLLWFRPEIVHTVHWAGSSENTLVVDDNGEPQLDPRHSFAAWAELVRGTSLPFQDSEVKLARELQLWLLDRLRISRLVHRPAVSSLHWNREQLNSLLGLLQDFIWQASPQDLRISYISPAVERITGYTPREFLEDGGLWSALIHPEDRDTVLLALRTRSTGNFDLEYRIVHRDGSPRWLHNRGKIIHDGASQSFVLEGIATDISSRKQVEHDLYQQANYDSLTGLPNRSLTLDRLTKLCEGQRRSPAQPFAVCFLDINRFKWINDSLGHEAGDRVLIHVSEQLRLSLRPGDTVGRIGGDEFVLLLPELAVLDDVLGIAQRIRSHLARPLEVAGQQLALKASIGIVLVEQDVAPEQVLRQADAAMYIAKRNGELYQVFDASTQVQSGGQLALLRELPAALTGGQFQVFYQPVMDLGSDTLWGFEALLRWQHPQRGLLTPDEFLPVIENLPMFRSLGFTLLGGIARQIRNWNRGREQPLVVSVNIATRQLLAEGFAEHLMAVLRESDCRPEWICLDITEDALFSNVPLALKCLEALRQQGLRVFIDDFGMGYSSLSHLHRFPVMGVKIDRSLVGELDHNLRDATIARAIVMVASALDLAVIAEGVENAAALDSLVAMGCGLGQGYYFGKPLPAPEAERWEFFSKAGKIPE